MVKNIRYRVKNCLEKQGTTKGYCPSQVKAWQYVFFIYFLGHVEEEKIQKLLDELGEFALNIKALGSFPRAQIKE